MPLFCCFFLAWRWW